MARLYTDIPFSGTFGNLTVYKVGDRCYVRTKSSLTQKRFQRDPAFARSREKALLFGEAARLVKAVYKELPKEVKQHGLFGKLTAIAYKGLQEEKSTDTIVQELNAYCGVPPALPISKRKPTATGKRPTLSYWKVTTGGHLLRHRLIATYTSLTQVSSIDRAFITASLPDG